ncbi:MAG: hypothetical protein EOP82_18525 [Variovorax sp.]|nr:MAG: hypothetical protein EOP82_18525 [Variovorax sp.]
MADAEAQAATRVPPVTALWVDRFPALAHLFHYLLGPGRFDRYQATLVDRWSIGRVVLNGDAAHAMPPTLGQGAGFAMMRASRSWGCALQQIFRDRTSCPDNALEATLCCTPHTPRNWMLSIYYRSQDLRAVRAFGADGSEIGVLKIQGAWGEAGSLRSAP